MKIIKGIFSAAAASLIMTLAACGSAHKAEIIAPTKDGPDTTISQGETAPPPAPKPGECTSDSDCDSGMTCDQGSCALKPPATPPPPVEPPAKKGNGEACAATDECDSGLECVQGTCRPVLPPAVIQLPGKKTIGLGLVVNLDVSAPTIVSYYLQGNDGVTITFSEPMTFDDNMDHALNALLIVNGNKLPLHPLGAIAWNKDKTTAYFKFPHSFLANPGSVSYTFTVTGGDKGPTDVAGNHLASDFTWSHSFTNEELGFDNTPPSTPTPTPTPTPTTTPTGWAVAKAGPNDFPWVLPVVGINPNDGTHTQDFWNQPRDTGSSQCQGSVAFQSFGMTGIRLKRASNVQATLSGDHTFENLSVQCTDAKNWASWLTSNPTWYYDYGALDYEATADLGYALDGFKVERCKNSNAIIGLTPMEVKVSSAGVDLTSSKEVSKGQFIIDDNTSCNDRETVETRCNLGTLGGSGIMKSVSVYYLNPVAQQGKTVCNPNTGVCNDTPPPPLDNSKNQAVGIGITCERICSADEIKAGAKGCDFK